MMGINFVKSLKRLFSAAPEGTAALFFIQIFSTLGFAVLYSTLVLYATKHLQFSVKAATTLMGVFGAFNYGLHRRKHSRADPEFCPELPVRFSGAWH
jgi:dipeptide/tripeptide permease